ncbi:hypothetical protein AAEU42_03270 [Pseudoflavonifractor phocaeensis]|uniref:hypothetical protein n=1 Tax=Pseudoflavonifractor phocaeensis TaxID=1870988 RepID=UPI00313C6153
MNWLRKMMYGRYGADQLNYALIALYFVLYLLSLLFRGHLLNLLSYACLILAFYRMFSRQIDRRQTENARFMDAVCPIVHWYNVNKCRRRDKDHAYFKCPNCGQQLRVPKGKGKVSITCRNCGVSFEEKT